MTTHVISRACAALLLVGFSLLPAPVVAASTGHFGQTADPAEEADRHMAVGSLLYETGDLQSALDELKLAQQLFHSANDRYNEEVAIGNIGVVYQDLGEYRQAMEYGQLALRLEREIGDRPGEASTLDNLGIDAWGLGSYAEGLAYCMQSLSIHREVKDKHGQAAALDNIGMIYRALGQYARAVDNIDQALALESEIGDRRGSAGTLGDLGGVYGDLGQYDRALEQFRRALAIQTETGDRVGMATTHNNIGAAQRNLGQYPEALAEYQQALTLLQDLHQQSGIGITLNNIGSVHRDLQEYDPALEAYQQALVIERSVGDLASEAITLANIGIAFEDQQQFDQALDTYSRALEVEDDIRTAGQLTEFKTSLAQRSATAYERDALLLERQGRYADAFHVVERARARSLLDQLLNAHLVGQKDEDRLLIEQDQTLRMEIADLYQRRQAALSRKAGEFDPEVVRGIERDLVTRKSADADLLTALELSNREYSSLRKGEAISLDEVQGLLDDNTTLVDYFVTTDAVLVFVVTQASLETLELPVSQRDLASTVEEFRSFAVLTGGPTPALARLSQWLIEPVLAQGLQTARVGIIPHGILNDLSFAALPYSDGYFGDAYTLFTLPSASVLPDIMGKRKGADDSMLALAHSHADGLPDLTNANQEAEAVSQLFGTTALIDAQATKSVLRSRSHDSAILHLAAHAELDPVNPLFSRIFLAPEAGDDGFLQVRDVYNLDLPNTDLVVLSACNTQPGEAGPGDDIVGLNRAFIYAGSPTVIASLWRVNDEATRLLMTSFYSHLKDGSPKAEALQAAQADVRHKQEYMDPYYWAAFVLTGDPGG